MAKTNQHYLLADRREYVYVVAPDRAERFAKLIANYLELDPRGRHPEDANAPHYVTTLYFDSDSHELAHACESGEDIVKLRAREYSQLSEDLGLYNRPQTWFEIKTRVGARTLKNRFSIPSSQVGDFLHDGAITKGLIAIHRERWGESAEVVFEEMAELCHKIHGPLRPVCLAHYRRRAWESADKTMRVTLDADLEFYRAPPTMFEDFMTLNQVVTGSPVTRADYGVIEIKVVDEFPAWLKVVLRDCGVDLRAQHKNPYSKFLAATRALAEEAQ